MFFLCVEWLLIFITISSNLFLFIMIENLLSANLIPSSTVTSYLKKQRWVLVVKTLNHCYFIIFSHLLYSSSNSWPYTHTHTTPFFNLLYILLSLNHLSFIYILSSVIFNLLIFYSFSYVSIICICTIVRHHHYHTDLIKCEDRFLFCNIFIRIAAMSSSMQFIVQRFVSLSSANKRIESFGMCTWVGITKYCT